MANHNNIKKDVTKPAREVALNLTGWVDGQSFRLFSLNQSQSLGKQKVILDCLR